MYNTTRQIGAVLGSACIAALMSSRLAAELGERAGDGAAMAAGGARQLPPEVATKFADAMAQSILLPAAVTAAGLLIVLLFEGAKHPGRAEAAQPSE